MLREKLWMSEEEAIEHLHLHLMLRSEKKKHQFGLWITMIQRGEKVTFL